MKTLKFYNKDGSLSGYSFLCGYIERTDRDNVQCDLYFDGGIYQIELYDRNEKQFGETDFNVIGGGRYWWSLDRLVDARSLYKKLSSRVKRGLDYSDLLVSMAQRNDRGII